MDERFLSGIAYLDAATALLRRVRSAHPTAGSLDAAEHRMTCAPTEAAEDLDFWSQTLVATPMVWRNERGEARPLLSARGVTIRGKVAQR